MNTQMKKYDRAIIMFDLDFPLLMTSQPKNEYPYALATFLENEYIRLNIMKNNTVKFHYVFGFKYFDNLHFVQFGSRIIN